MSRRTPPIYQCGKYWLGFNELADGRQRSPNLYVWWYDAGARRERGTSTCTVDQADAILFLDKLYLADKGEAPAFCQSCGQTLAQANAYLLTDAIADYKIEWGNTRASADTIASRLTHAIAFLDAEQALGAQGRFGHTITCAVACASVFVHAFRAWSKQQPIEWRNGKGDVTVSRARSPAATEASIAQLIAVLNHAANAEPPRSDKRPIYKPLPARQVQRKRRTRIGIEELAQMLSYAAEPGRQRGSLHAFLVASICTLARPGAVVDVNVAPDREQWWPGATTIDLNPQGRTQNKKHRALVPVPPVLDRWLRAEYATFMDLKPEDRVGRGWLVNYHGRPVQDVDRAWDTMLTKLELPKGREWRSYLLRHSLATLARNRGATKWDLEGFMGHSDGSQTEVYAIGEFPSVVTALIGILADLERLVPGALHRTGTEQPEAAAPTGATKM
jgi:integrase